MISHRVFLKYIFTKLLYEYELRLVSRMNRNKYAPMNMIIFVLCVRIYDMTYGATVGARAANSNLIK